MRRWFAPPVVFVAAAALALQSPPPAAAQPGPEEESFLTADGVQLKGVFHATDKNPGSAPVVILMYPPGRDQDMTKGDWPGLAKALNAQGYHAFRFDWRGHGKSTDIKDPDKFWRNGFMNAGNNFNAAIKGGGLKKPFKDTLTFKDLTKADKFFPTYLNDLAAVRVHLDTKNDNKTVNTSSIYLVGAGDAAALGMAWVAAEWQRPAVFPPPGLLGINVPGYEVVPQRLTGAFPAEGGQDIGGAVWLSPTRPAAVPEKVAKGWVTAFAPKLRENNPMLFLHGEKDAAGKQGATFYYNDVLVAEPRKGAGLSRLEQTFMKEVKGSADLSGVKLLGRGDPKKTDDIIIDFLAAIQKERAKTPSKARGYTNPYFIDLRYFGYNP